MQQSPNSAFVKPRKEQQRAKTAEKIATERFHGSRRNIVQKSDSIERREPKQPEQNNNETSVRIPGISSYSSRHTADSTGIPRRNFSKSAEPDNFANQKKDGERISPKPRRKLPSAPIPSGPRPRTPKHNSDIPNRAVPNSIEKSFDKPKATLSTTPESFLPKDKKNKIIDDATNVNRKSSDPLEMAKSRSIIGGIKYNSLPRRRPSKTRSKFYLDIEGEESLPAKASGDIENKPTDNTEPVNGVNCQKKSQQENGSERLSSIFKGGKIFGAPTMKSVNSENPLMSNGSGEKNDLKQTHVALYKFIPRHKDEVMLEEGDPINVLKISDDLWFEGTNLANGKYGIFPSRYAADILSGSTSVFSGNPEDQQFFLRFLGSVEVADYKGDEILCYAISKIVNQRAMLSSNTPPACTLQVTSRGIRVCDFDEKQSNSKSPKFSKKGKGKDKEKQKETRDNSAVPTHFFSLKNVTFCGNHPRDRRYFGFITKHPDEHRFACHVFMSKYTTDPVAQAVGDCFKKFYNQYLDYRAPTEDIYME